MAGRASSLGAHTVTPPTLSELRPGSRDDSALVQHAVARNPLTGSDLWGAMGPSAEDIANLSNSQSMPSSWDHVIGVEPSDAQSPGMTNAIEARMETGPTSAPNNSAHRQERRPLVRLTAAGNTVVLAADENVYQVRRETLPPNAAAWQALASLGGANATNYGASLFGANATNYGASLFGANATNYGASLRGTNATNYGNSLGGANATLYGTSYRHGDIPANATNFGMSLGDPLATSDGMSFGAPPAFDPDLCDPDTLVAEHLTHALEEDDDVACAAALREPRAGQRATRYLLRQALASLDGDVIAGRERAARVLRTGELSFWNAAPWEGWRPSDEEVNRLRATGAHPILVARYACLPPRPWHSVTQPAPRLTYDERLEWLRNNLPMPLHVTPGFRARRDVFEVPQVLRGNPQAWQGKFMVSMEKGIDSGGLTRDWLTQMLRGCTDPANKILEGRGRDKAQLFFHSSLAGPLTSAQKEDVELFGHLLAKAITEGAPCPELFVAPRLLAQLAGHDVASGLEALAEIDAEAADSLRNTLKLSAEAFAAQPMPFGLEDPANPLGPEIPLDPSQPNLLVNVDNVEEFVRLKAKAMLDAYNPALEIFAKAFYSTGITLPFLQPFTVAELDNIVGGERVFDADDWRNNTRVTFPEGTVDGWPVWKTTSDPQGFPQVVQWFFEVVKELPPDEQKKLLWLITASSAPPAGGFKRLRPRLFNIAVGVDMSLALTGHTCFCKLDLPNYASKDDLQAEIKMWIAETGAYTTH